MKLIWFAAGASFTLFGLAATAVWGTRRHLPWL